MYDQSIQRGLVGQEGLSPKEMYQHRTKLERLHDAKKGLESKLAEVNKAIELMEANPKMVEIIDALERAGY